ncbi:hypothetical protein HAHE_12870 [Haloferula helveola]|uniref:Uncharacterized protein n=1 Tax=Haloferula helveola TaxID=490095 RepID=A0ABN6H4N8_9BACT|nr:hypothetical protein HAHE_12870 [Haloferula helveola]
MIQRVLAAVFLFSLAGPVFAEDKPGLDELLDERIEANEKYRDRFAKEAEESPYAKDLQPLEKKIGQEWVDFLKHVKASEDEKLKLHTLRLEFMDELRGCYYDLEYAEGVLERATIRSEILKWKKKVERVEELAKAPVADGEPTE